jgi:hypothetical protein
VFKGPVDRTGKKTGTKLNTTEYNWTSSCGYTNLAVFQFPVASNEVKKKTAQKPVSIGCNQSSNSDTLLPNIILFTLY